MKISNGIWSILGILAFFSIEKIFPDEKETSETEVMPSNRKSDKLQTRTKSQKTSKTFFKKKSKKFIFLHSFKV